MVGQQQLLEVAGLARKERYIDALTALSDGLGEPAFGAAVEGLLDDRRVEAPEVARAIAALGSRLRAVLTTNLDRLLEKAFAGDWEAFPRATADIASRRGYILKLHGTLGDRSTWVLTRPQYERAMYLDDRLAGAFTALFHACPMLFVGYGLEDADFEAVLGSVRALSQGQPAQHFALMDAAKVTGYGRTQVEKAGIRLLCYENSDQRHQEVIRTLRWLAAPEESAAARSAADGAAGGRPQPVMDGAGAEVVVPPVANARLPSSTPSATPQSSSRQPPADPAQWAELRRLLHEVLPRLLELTPAALRPKLEKWLAAEVALDPCGILGVLCQVLEALQDAKPRSAFGAAARPLVWAIARALTAEVRPLERVPGTLSAVEVKTRCFVELLVAASQEGREPRFARPEQGPGAERSLTAEEELRHPRGEDLIFDEGRDQLLEPGAAEQPWQEAFERYLWKERLSQNVRYVPERHREQLYGELEARQILHRAWYVLLDPSAAKRAPWESIAPSMPSVIFLEPQASPARKVSVNEHTLAALMRTFLKLGGDEQAPHG